MASNVTITIGDLKAQAIKLMGINNAMDITGDEVSGYKNDPTYGTYLHSMNGAINRCLGRMYVVGALEEEPKQVYPIATPIQGGGVITEDSQGIAWYAEGITFTLANLIPLYIVGDVFALDEPSVAQNRRNEFEQALEDYVNKRMQNTGEIELVYACE